MLKSIRLTAGFVTLAQFKARTSAHLRTIREQDEPLVLTRNGRPAVVLLSPEAYERAIRRYHYLEAVATGLADVESGRAVDNGQAAEWLSTVTGARGPETGR